MSDTSRRLKLPRGRRSGLASVLALILIAAAVLVAVAGFQIATGHDSTVLGSVSAVTHWLRTHHWRDAVVLIVGIVAAAIGFLLVLFGLFPARRPLVRLADLDPNTISGVARRGLVRDLTSVASKVNGAAKVKVTLRRHRVVVRAQAALRNRTGLAEALHAAVTQRLDALQPAQPITVRTRVVGRKV